jgi:flagellar biosynthesis GTPase FlhF
MGRRLKVDMTGVESFQKAGEGQHVVKIVSAEEATSQGGNEVIKVSFEVTKGTDKGSRVFEIYPLVETALWKLKGLLQALNMKCDGKVMLDLDKLEGKICIIEVVHEEYNGVVRAKVSEVKKLQAENDEEDEDEDFDDEEDEEEEEKPKKKAPAKRSAAPKKKTNTKKVEEPADDEDEEEDDFEDEEEEEEKPKKKPVKKPTAKKPAPKKTTKKKPAEDEDEEDWDEEDDEDWDDEE